MQGTNEWHEFRLEKITASKLYDVCHAPVAGASNHSASSNHSDEEAKEHGTTHEAKAREVWARQNKTMVYIPPAISSGDEEIPEIPNYSQVKKVLSASADGITNDGCLIEIKCPYRANWTNIVVNPQNIPERYRYQIQFSLHVLNLKKCHLIRYLPPRGNANREVPENKIDGDLVVTTILRDKTFFETRLPNADCTIGQLVSREAQTLMNKKKYIIPLNQVGYDEFRSLLEHIEEVDLKAGDSFRSKFQKNFKKF